MPGPPLNQLGYNSPGYGAAASAAASAPYYPSAIGPATQQSPGFFGQGTYQAQPIPINQSTFQNPLGPQVQGQLGSEINNYLPNTTAPITAATAAGGGQGAFNTGFGGEGSLAAQYAAMAAGNGPSQATVAAKQAGAQGIANAESVLGSARGAGNPGAAQLGAANAIANTNQATAGNEVAGRTAEEMGALGAEGGLYTSMAGQGLTEQQLQAQANQFNAAQQNQIAQGNQANRLAGNTNYLGFLGGQGLGWGQIGAGGAGLSANTQLGLQGIQSGAFGSGAGNAMQLGGSLLQGAAGAGALLL